MTLSGLFVAVAGSVTGADHRRAERDGQDGHAVASSEHVVAAIVTDGCGSGRSSEIGARVGARWIAALVAQHFRGCTDETAARTAAAAVTRDLIERLGVLARSFDPEGELRAARVEDALLFTFLAAVVTPSVALVFGVGDGSFLVHGVVEGRVGGLVDEAFTAIDPGPDNAPPYAAYALFEKPIATTVHFVSATADVALLAVATDGVASREDLVQLAGDRRYETNPSLLRKRMIVLSDHGQLSDDATIGVIRRRSP